MMFAPTYLILLAISIISRSAIAFTPSTETVRKLRFWGSSVLHIYPTGCGVDTAEPVLSISSIFVSRLFQTIDPSEARGLFWFSFVAGSGGLGIGIAQIPRLLEELSDVRSLEDQGPSEGGEKVNLGPIAGLIYPSPTAKDIGKVLRNAPTPEAIYKKSKSENYFATKGYVVEEDFVEMMQGCNPLAIRVVFDALTGGKGGAVAPDDYSEKLGKWKDDASVSSLVNDLQGSATTRLASYATLLFLIALIGDFIIEYGINGFMS